MAKVPPLNSERFPKGSIDEKVAPSPRLNEQMTPRALWEIVKDDSKWAVLLEDPSGAFGKGDIIDVRYQKYLAEVVPIMQEEDVTFKTAVDILAGRTGGKAQSSHAKGSPKKGKLRKEVIKEHGAVPKLREEVDEKDQPDLKVIDEKDQLDELEPKALDVDMEQKSLTRARDFTKATGRSSSEPITPKRPDKEQALVRQQGGVPLSRPDQLERVVYVETRPQVAHKAVAIQTEEAAPSQLLQPLLSRPSVPSSKPKARKKKDEMKEIPIQYQDCSCGRICFSTAMKFILACAMVFTVIWCADNYNEVLNFFEGPLFQNKEPAATTGKGHSKKDHKSTEPKEPKHPPLSPVSQHHEEKPESHSHEGTAQQGKESRTMHPTPPPKTDLELAKETLNKELKKLERLDEEQAQTARVGELARLSQKENEQQAADSQNKDEHLRQAALDAEVQAKVAQQELEEDREIRSQKQKVKDAQARVDELESAKRETQSFLALK